VTFGMPPALGVVPVRFDTDQMAGTIEIYRLYAWQ
jgi:hypothetical protein